MKWRVALVFINLVTGDVDDKKIIEDSKYDTEEDCVNAALDLAPQVRHGVLVTCEMIADQ